MTNLSFHQFRVVSADFWKFTGFHAVIGDPHDILLKEKSYNRKPYFYLAFQCCSFSAFRFTNKDLI